MSLNADSTVRNSEMATKINPIIAVTPIVPKWMLPTKSRMRLAISARRVAPGSACPGIPALASDNPSVGAMLSTTRSSMAVSFWREPSLRASNTSDATVSDTASSGTNASSVV